VGGVLGVGVDGVGVDGVGVLGVGVDGAGVAGEVDVVDPEGVSELGGSAVEPPHATTTSDNARVDAIAVSEREEKKKKEKKNASWLLLPSAALGRALLSTDRSIAYHRGSLAKAALPRRSVNVRSRIGRRARLAPLRARQVVGFAMAEIRAISLCRSAAFSCWPTSSKPRAISLSTSTSWGFAR